MASAVQVHAAGTKLPCAEPLTRNGELICCFHPNHLTSTSIQTDQNGNRIQHYEYTAFGRTRFTESASAFPVSRRYTCQVLDEETGLYYYASRYYDPQLGRFIQPDDIISDLSNPQSYNRYSYVLNNPLRYTDPSGQTPAVVLGLAVVAVFFSTERYAVAPENAEQASNPYYRGYTDNVLQFVDLPVGLARAGAMHGGAAVPKVVKRSVQVEAAVSKTLLEQAENVGASMAHEAASKSRNVGTIVNKGGLAPVNKGKLGEAMSEAEARAAGETIKGKQVTFELPSGRRTRSDLLTETKGPSLKVREAKHGLGAKLTPGQTELQHAVESGDSVIPRGLRAQQAGLEPGKPTKIQQFEVDKF